MERRQCGANSRYIGGQFCVKIHNQIREIQSRYLEGEDFPEKKNAENFFVHQITVYDPTNVQ